MSLTLLARRTSTSSQVTLGCLSWTLPKAPTIQTDLQKSFLSSSSSSSFLQTTRPVPLLSPFSFSLAGSRSYTTNANRPAKEEKKRQIAAARKLLKKQEELLDDDDEDEVIILEDAPPRPPPHHEPLVASSALKIEQEEKKNEDDEEDSLFDAVDGSATKRKGKGEEPQFPPKAAKAFIKLGIEKQLTCGVRSFGITTPTPIQEIAIPKILDGASAVLSAQTGTGKTLAYLLPILQLLHRDEKIFLNARELSALEASLGIHEDPNKHLLDESIYKEFLGSQDENAKEIDEEEEEDDEEDDDDDDYEGDEKDSVEENGADEELVLEADEEGEPGSTQTVANARRKKSKLKKKERKRIKRMMSQQKERISEVGDPERDVLRRPKRPRALILVPSRELGLQIYKFTKQIIVSCKWPIRSGCILGGSTKTSIQKKLLSDNNGVDLLIASPDRFLKLRELGAVYYTDMRYLVVDEADTMLVDDFGTKVLEVLRVLKDIKTHSGEHTQLVLASATITPSLLQIVSTSWPEALNLIAPNTNSLLAKATYKFYHATGDKMDELENILNRDTTSRQIIVFCTSVDSCRAVDYHLLAKGFDAVSLHGAIPPKKRTELYEKFQNQQAKILVCTDLASRGLDTINVDHVVMFDFPSNGVDFLHRSGRTARAGRKGLVSCIIRQKDKDFVYLIENALRNGKNIENLDRKMAGSLRKSIEETVRAKRKEAKEKRREDDESGARRSEHKSNLGSRSRARTSTIKKHVPIVYPRT